MSKAINALKLAPCILLCQHRSCRKAGSAKVLQTFRELAPPEVSIVACGCLGHCGSGPNATLMPEEIPYNSLQPMDAADIIKHHWG